MYHDVYVRITSNYAPKIISMNNSFKNKETHKTKTTLKYYLGLARQEKKWVNELLSYQYLEKIGNKKSRLK